jgi:hypothetical protein
MIWEEFLRQKFPDGECAHNMDDGGGSRAQAMRQRVWLRLTGQPDSAKVAEKPPTQA